MSYAGLCSFFPVMPERWWTDWRVTVKPKLLLIRKQTVMAGVEAILAVSGQTGFLVNIKIPLYGCFFWLILILPSARQNNWRHIPDVSLKWAFIVVKFTICTSKINAVWNANIFYVCVLSQIQSIPCLRCSFKCVTASCFCYLTVGISCKFPAFQWLYIQFILGGGSWRRVGGLLQRAHANTQITHLPSTAFYSILNSLVDSA